jgi:O-acetylserine/cysteine efflux transporter
MSAKHALMGVAVAALWGANFAAVKIGTEEFPPVFMLALRFALVATLMLPFVNRPRRPEVLPILAVSITLGGLHFGLMFVGLNFIDASSAAIAGQLGVPFSTILAVIFFDEKLGWRRVVGVTVAFAGVAILAGAPRLDGQLVGLFVVITSSFAWAVSNIILKRYGPVQPFTLTGWMALFAVPQLLLVSAVMETNQWQAVIAADWTGWAALLYTVVGSSILAYGLWYTLINKHPVSHVVSFTLLAPVFAVAAAATILSEPVTLSLVLGGLLTLLGVGIVEIRMRRLRWRRRRSPDVAAPPELGP